MERKEVVDKDLRSLPRSSSVNLH